jgi:UDP-N-acetylmuramoyl-L-alanyl-D-glutamate--2,6-diaminopimelate ligase
MRLGELVAGVACIDAPADVAEVEVEGLAYDSREVRAGDMYCCVQGDRYDGHEFARQAIAGGAVALLVQRRLGLDVPEVVVESVRAAMGPLADRLNDEPTRRLQVVGITGTNGKTTSAFMVRALLEATGVQAGLLGTVKSVVGGEERPVARTTPEAIDLQAGFREMLQAGDGACAMEVSSHALAMGRTRGIAFAGAVFTNLTQDHLDYHATMEDYYLAKRRLFLPDDGSRPPGVSVVNVGDPYGRRLAREIGAKAVTFVVEDAVGRARGWADDRDEPVLRIDYRASDVRCDAGRCRFVLHLSDVEGGCRREIQLPMPGRFNVENAVGALAVVHELGGDLDELVGALADGVRVPGRFEPVPAGGEPAVIVDYAHTPDSLENVLRAAREIARGRVVCVFGAGGDRDRGKRPLMGEIAARLADVAVVTSDNPRSESPEAIIAEIAAGMSSAAGEVHMEVDRHKAIEWAIQAAQAEDMIVIAGKGHEQGQELAGGVKVPFDDKVVAAEILVAQRERGAVGARR